MARKAQPGLDPLGYGPYERTLMDLMDGKPMRLFKLFRHEDPSGVSGTGYVAEGVIWSDGSVAVRWLGEYASTITYMSIGDVEQVHGHNGQTEVVYL